MKRYTMGFDIGTGSTKAVLADMQGNVAATWQAGHETIVEHPGWQEQDMALWWREFQDAAASFLKKVESPEQIACVGVTGLLPGCCAVNAQGEPVRRAILHTDVRAAKELAFAARRLPNKAVSHGHMLPKVLWMKNHEPALFGKVWRFLVPHGYLVHRLTGNATMDYDAACMVGGLFDEDRLAWREDAFGAVGLSSDIFPAPGPASGMAGTLTAEAAAATGLAPQTKVIAGVGDTFASMLGGGAYAKGHVMLYLGTSATLLYTEENPVNFAGLPHYGPGKAGFVGRILSFGESATHLQTVLQSGGWAELDGRLDTIPPGAEGLWYFPHYKLQTGVSGFGSDAEHILGFRGRHSRYHLYRALMEGIAYNARHNLEGLSGPVEQVNVFGGGANSPEVCRLLADVLGRPLRVNPKSSTALGAAFLAAFGAGYIEEADDLRRVWLRGGDTVQPDPEKARLYDALYPVYWRLRRRLKALDQEFAEGELP